MLFFYSFYWENTYIVHFRNVLCKSVVCHTLLSLFQKHKCLQSFQLKKKEKKEENTSTKQKKVRRICSPRHVMISWRLVSQTSVISKHLATFPYECVLGGVCDKKVSLRSIVCLAPSRVASILMHYNAFTILRRQWWIGSKLFVLSAFITSFISLT